MTELDSTNDKRLKKFLVKLVDLTGGKDCKCMAIGYYRDKEYVEDVLSDLNMQDYPSKYDGFALQLDKLHELDELYKLIFYDDSLPLITKLRVFAHETGHSL